MKPGLAILPLEVWADVSEHPLITRQMLAQIADSNGDPYFTNILQKLLHGCGNQTLHYLKISKKQKILKSRAFLAVTHDSQFAQNYEDCEFPVDEMPENIKKFKRLTIGYLDDQILTFLDIIKPLFANVFLNIGSIILTNMRILFEYFLPMIASIRGIKCDHDCVEVLEQDFPGTLAQVKELDLYADPALISTYLNWLSAPQNVDVHGPKFLKLPVAPNTIFVVVDAVRKRFLSATAPATFVALIIYITPLGRGQQSPEHFTNEFTIGNAATNEQLTVHNACFQMPKNYGSNKINYVEIVRHPKGEDAILRERLRERAYAYYATKYNNEDWEEQVISIGGYPTLTIGHITKKVAAFDQENDQTGEEDGGDKDATEPSNSGDDK